MTSLVHAHPAIRRTGTPGSRTATLPSGHVVASLGLALVVCLVVLALVVLAITGIDTAGRLPHPQPLPAPNAPSSSGG